MKVLLVEPDAALRGSLVFFLINTGVGVLQAGNAAEALRFVPDIGDHDVLIINQVLDAGISGFDLAGRVREHRPLAPLILMCEPSQPAPVFSVGSNDRLLPMPFGVDRLLELMRQVIQVDRGIDAAGPDGAVNYADVQRNREANRLVDEGEDYAGFSWLPGFRR
jgi:DNA-binding response OmpR family regulator